MYVLPATSLSDGLKQERVEIGKSLLQLEKNITQSWRKTLEPTNSIPKLGVRLYHCVSPGA